MSLRSLLNRFKTVFNSKLGHARVERRKTLSRTYEYYANRGPEFEPPLIACENDHANARVKAIAFYLPQFHRFPENDGWWGSGFTEWHNVARGTPRYEGHYQPRIPSDLGFYDLTDVGVLENQATLAKENGIAAFCFYYYWFNGKRLMQKPVDLFADANMPIDFCLMWANENWTRAWDGLENEILIQQDYREEDERAFIEDTARYMANPNYFRIVDRPVFIMYRASLLPEPRKTLARWRNLWTQQLGVEPWILMSQSFDEENPEPYGLDGAVEFPPHKICRGLSNLRKHVTLLDEDFSGLIRDYDSVVNQSLSLPVPNFPEIKTVSPSWDNDARRQSRATSFMGATPVAFERWINGAVELANKHPFHGEPLVFINAWNEWAEGAYLEPDVHYGHAMLNAVKRAVFDFKGRGEKAPVLLLGHDAHKHGSQMLLVHLAKTLKEDIKVDVCIVLQEGGSLVREYQQFARTTVLAKEGLTEHLQRLGTPLDNFQLVIANTTVSGNLLPDVKQAGVASISLVHELPALIQDYKLEQHVKNIADCADHVVFAADIIKQGFESFGNTIQGVSHIQPQGSYLSVAYNEIDRQRFRESLGLDECHRLIINVGFADTRKGFDLFIETAQKAIEKHATWHFAWIGKLHSDMQSLADKALKNDELRQRVHLTGFVGGNTNHFSAADAFFLSSREDPYPTVVLEALEAGLPVVAYQKCTGVTTLAEKFGALVPCGNAVETNKSLERLLNNDNPSIRQSRTNYVRNNCGFIQYCKALLSYENVEFNEP